MKKIFLAGCFDVEETIWIHPDGSGRLKFDVTLHMSVKKDKKKDQKKR